MNQDFALLASPALARRLLHLNRFGLLELPADVHRLALDDLLTDAFDHACSHTPERAMISQFLLDSGMRGIVQAQYHPSFDEMAILNVIRLSGIQKITILTHRIGRWRSRVNGYFPTKVEILTPYDLPGSWIEERRQGVLLLDICPKMGDISRLLREFPRAILYQSLSVGLGELTHWTELAAMLFPSMPHPWTIRHSKDNPADWVMKPLSDFALFYNFCLFPEFITSGKLLDSLQDSRLDLSVFH